MTVSKEIVCPLCKKTHQLMLGGLLHDKDLNLICSSCNGVMFAVTEEPEKNLKSLVVGHTGVNYHYYPKKEPLPIAMSAVTEGECQTQCHLDVKAKTPDPVTAFQEGFSQGIREVVQELAEGDEEPLYI